MSLRWLAVTAMGRLASWLLVVFVVILVVNVAVVQPLLEPSDDRSWPELAIVWTGAGVALAAAAIALVAVIRDNEQAIVVYLACLPILLVAGLNLGSLLG